jgi:E3 ubiquitin-protein ligase MARCH5
MKGQEEEKAAMEHMDPLMLLVGLPSIPIMLVLGKLIRWEDHILKLWRKNHHKIPFLGYLFGNPSEKARDSTERNLLSRDSFSDPISLCRMFCGALLMPTAATIVGRCLYDSFSSNFHKTILVSILYILFNSFLMIDNSFP